MTNFEDGGRAIIEGFGEMLKEDCKDQKPDKDRSLWTRSWGNRRTYSLPASDSEVTVVVRERERTRLGQLFMGPLTTRSLLAVDLEGPFDELSGAPYSQFFMTDSDLMPMARQGFRNFGSGISDNGFVDLIGYPEQADLEIPTEGQLSMLEGALHELASR